MTDARPIEVVIAALLVLALPGVYFLLLAWIYGAWC